MDIVIPNFTFYGAFIIVTCMLTSMMKMLIKWKPIYPFLPIMLAALFGSVYGISTIGFTKDLPLEIFKNIFTIAAGAIMSYDVVIEKIKKYINKEQHNDTDETK
jgi:hypothetical protein